MQPNYIEAGFKTKEEAVGKILQMLIENPAVVGTDGYLNITALGNHYRLKPVKKKQQE